MAQAGLTIQSRSEELEAVCLLSYDYFCGGTILTFEREFEGKYVAIGKLSGYYATVIYHLEIFRTIGQLYGVYLVRSVKNLKGASVVERAFEHEDLMECLLWIDKQTIKKDGVYIHYDN